MTKESFRSIKKRGKTMQQVEAHKEGLMPDSIVTAQVAMTRMAIGLVQGLILYFLYHASKNNSWPATEAYLFAPLLIATVLAPVILISGLGHLPTRQAVIWFVVAIVMIGLLGVYDIWRGGSGHMFEAYQANTPHSRYPSVMLFVFCVVGFSIAHSLVLAGSHDNRRIANYPTYFELAWKLLIQIKFSVFFVCVLWLVLWLGAALFMLVKLNFLKDLLQEAWFSIPVTAFAYSCAIHITDVRPAIVRGIRTLLLVLLSWLLPITIVIVVGFLITLPWTGLTPLWATRHAASVLLGAAAVLVVLINAAFQNGEIESSVARVIRISARVAAISLVPIVAIAIYAVALRVGDYGWTTDRIIAAFCLFVATCYALGYAWAAFHKGGWLAPIAQVNVATAFVILAVLLVLFSPIADPARMSVNDQMARFAAGKVSADKFDFDYLKFEGARFGLAALAQLKSRTQGADAALIREKAAAALQKEHRWSSTAAPKLTHWAANLDVWPKSEKLPDSFLKQNWNEVKGNWNLPRCLTQEKRTCDAYLIDFNGDGKPEVLLVGTESITGAALLMENGDHKWEVAGQLPYTVAGCSSVHQKLQSGDYKLIAPRLQDIEIDGQRIAIQNNNHQENFGCAGPKK
jgi:hypothetical protein